MECNARQGNKCGVARQRQLHRPPDWLKKKLRVAQVKQKERSLHFTILEAGACLLVEQTRLGFTLAMHWARQIRNFSLHAPSAAEGMRKVTDTMRTGIFISSAVPLTRMRLPSPLVERFPVLMSASFGVLTPIKQEVEEASPPKRPLPASRDDEAKFTNKQSRAAASGEEVVPLKKERLRQKQASQRPEN